MVTALPDNLQRPQLFKQGSMVYRLGKRLLKTVIVVIIVILRGNNPKDLKPELFQESGCLAEEYFLAAHSLSVFKSTTVNGLSQKIG